MAFAITQTCCTDASCVTVCPVNCIHPTPDEPDFGSTEMLYIDPESCIDCSACADACPVDAIFPVEKLSASLQPYAEVNAAYYAGRPSAERADPAPLFHEWDAPTFRPIPADLPVFDVAVVGTGPSGMYAVAELLLHTTARVTLIDRLPVAGGLVRFGVAPDHPSTRRIDETFARYRSHHRLRLRLGVEVGRDVTAEQLAQRHDAVIYAVGAFAGRSLGVPGEELPGSVSASTAVGWYNGHPDVAGDALDLSTERAVVVGTGNVALDVARILTADPDELAGTEIAREALDRLRASAVREVVLLGRRGPGDAAYTHPELRAVAAREGVELVVDEHDPAIGRAIDDAVPGDRASLLRGVRRERVDWSAPPPGGRRIVLRFHSSTEEILGDERVRGVRATGADGAASIPAGLVVRAIGHRGTPVPGLPFDDAAGNVPNTAGRVDGMPGSYVVGWIKRGPSGGIGANRACATETVGSLLDDVTTGRTSPAPRSGLGPALRRWRRGVTGG